MAPVTTTDERALDSATIREELRARALALGFRRVGFCRADVDLDPDGRFAEWLARGHHAGMRYLAKAGPRRARATDLLPAARTILVGAAPYSPNSGDDAGVAAYARREDYHGRLSAALEDVLALARARAPGTSGLVCVDTKPLLERQAAALAGVGFIGKNTLLLSIEDGPWTMLGCLLLSIDLPPDAPEKPRCGTCTRCLDACPTGAFVQPFVLDARRCLSYWTIEHRGAVPVEMREKQGLRVFGCDDCLTACPFGPPKTADGDRLLPLAPELRDLSPEEALTRAERGFRRSFGRYAIQRAGKAGLIRNCLTAIGNRARADSAPLVRRYLDHADAGVREHAAWALEKIRLNRDAAGERSA